MPDDFDDDFPGVIASGPMPEWLRDRRLPALPPDTDPTVAHLVSLAAAHPDRIGVTAEEALRMRPREAREAILRANAILGIKPILMRNLP